MRVVLLLTALAACSPSPEQVALATCRTAIQGLLVDPLSAQFTGEKRVSGDHTATTYSLTVNARNKLGGYSGREVRECSVDPTGLAVIYLSRGEH